MTDIYNFLKENNIPYQKFDHPAVFTCEESKKMCPEMPGVSIKNLFLVDKKDNNFYLVVVGCDKSVDLKKLREILLVSKKLTFASAEDLQKYLGVDPGAVTMLGLIHDTEHKVKVYVDEIIWGQSLGCHPLVNTATLVIAPEGIIKFMAATGHFYKVAAIPAR